MYIFHVPLFFQENIIYISMHFFFYFINMIKRSTLFCFAGRMYTIVSFNIIFVCHRHPGLVLPSITTPSFSQNPKKSERGKEREREGEREGERESRSGKRRGGREERRGGCVTRTGNRKKDTHTRTEKEKMMKVFAVVAMMMIAMFAGAHAASVDLDQSNFDEMVRASRGSGNRGGGGGGGDRSGGWGMGRGGGEVMQEKPDWISRK